MKYLSVSEVAERLGNHEKTVRRYIANGDLQAKKIGGQWRIAESWFDNYLKQESAETAHHEPAHHEDFCVFMDSDYFESEALVQTCTILDITHPEGELYQLKAKSKAYDILARGEKFKLEIRPHGSGSRIVMWGAPETIKEVLEVLS
ncbi:MAG TPA: helix-turn-helix domain-containing protein [Tissierellia bacterium]|nr:helix-turn-helix domain-containing protein [Tissierellia bacterium]